jgi:hypothetical protein
MLASNPRPNVRVHHQAERDDQPAMVPALILSFIFLASMASLLGIAVIKLGEWVGLW